MMEMPTHKFKRKVPKSMSGFSLLELAIVLLIVGLVMGASLKAGVAYISIEKRKVTIARLSALDTAFVNYVAQNKRLPCPADGATASGNVNAGVEQRTAANGVCTTVNRGVVPWVSLGISEGDAQDGWFNRITYKVISAKVGPANIGLTSNEALDMTQCDPAGTGALEDRSFSLQSVSTCKQKPPCASNSLVNCTSVSTFLDNRGIQIRDGVLGNILMNPAQGTGAAYVLISHGDNAVGAYSSSGTIQSANGIAASALEIQNRNNVPILQTYFINAPQNIDSVGLTHFDDILSYPSLHSVINKAQLGARASL